MDGNQIMTSVPSAASTFRKFHAVILTSIASGGLLISNSGCKITKPVSLNSSPQAHHAAQPLRSGSSVAWSCPTCALPQNFVAPQTNLPTQEPASTFRNPHSPTQPVAVHIQSPPETVPPAGSQAWLLDPPAGNMPPDLNGQSQAAFPSAQQPAFPPPVPAEPAYAAELSQCQKRLEELNQQITSLQETSERSQQAMQVMVAEQKNLQRQNLELKRRVEKTDQQYLESMDSLSQIIDEVMSPPAPAVNRVPASSFGSKKPNQDSSEIELPSVDETL
jgi:uncharacterized coiled-coil protein SlyX